MIFWLERPFFRFSVGVSEAKDAIDWDLDAANADGVVLVVFLPLGAASGADKKFSPVLFPFLPGDFLVSLLGRVGDSVSVMGLTSRSGGIGLGGRTSFGGSERLFHGVEELPRSTGRLESLRGTGVALAEP